MGNYINNAEHKAAVRCIQLLAYLSLLGVLAVVMIFIISSLKNHRSVDSQVFFLLMILSLTGSALNCAVGISLPHAGKFSYYKIPVHLFIITDIIGLGHGIRSLTAKGHDFGDLLPFIFYVAFYLGCLVCNILFLRFLNSAISRRIATVSSVVIILLISLHIADITYCLIYPDAFADAEPNKNNLIRLSSNLVFLLTAISSMIVVRIKPKESEHTYEDPFRDQ